jgi:hypothetical protein
VGREPLARKRGQLPGREAGDGVRSPPRRAATRWRRRAGRERRPGRLAWRRARAAQARRQRSSRLARTAPSNGTGPGGLLRLATDTGCATSRHSSPAGSAGPPEVVPGTIPPGRQATSRPWGHARRFAAAGGAPPALGLALSRLPGTGQPGVGARGAPRAMTWHPGRGRAPPTGGSRARENRPGRARRRPQGPRPVARADRPGRRGARRGVSG